MDPRLVLIIEDNPDDEALTRRALRDAQLPIEVRVARDGAEACDYLFSAANALPTLVLLDLKLPKLDGLELLQRIRSDQRTARLCTVVFTSSSEARDIDSAYALGCNSYVAKPVAYETYLATVRHIGQFWIMYNRSPLRAG